MTEPSVNGPIEPPAIVPPARLSNAQVGRIIFAGMCGIACLTLAFALTTTSLRRANDNKNQPNKQYVAADEPAPANWAAMGWLPDRVNVAIGLRVRELAESPAGQDVLNRALPGGSVFDIPLSDVREFVVAGDLTTLPPRFVVVVRTERPIDPAVVKVALKAKRGDRVAGKVVDRFATKIGLIELDVGLWQADDRTLVVALADDFKDVPTASKPIAGRCPKPFVELLERNLPAQSSAWLVAELPADTPWLSYSTLLKPTKPDDAAAVTALRKLTVAVPHGGVGPFAVRGSGDTAALAKWMRESLKLADVRADGDWVTGEARDLQHLLAPWPGAMKDRNEN